MCVGTFWEAVFGLLDCAQDKNGLCVLYKEGRKQSVSTYKAYKLFFLNCTGGKGLLTISC